MTGPPQPPDRDTDPEPIGVILARLRQQKRISGSALGHAAGMSQSKVSRIERGLALPSPDEVDCLVAVLGAPAGLAVTLRRRAVQLRARAIDARVAGKPRLGVLQKQMADLEKAATTIGIFQAGVLPGLIQTDEYARAILSAFARPLSGAAAGAKRLDVLRTVDQRMRRQQVLTDLGKKVTLLFTEAVLTYQLCPPDVMLTQLRKIRAHAHLPNVTIGILQQDVQLPYPPLLGFEILDDKAVVVDLPTPAAYARGGEDVDVFQTIFGWYLEAATTDIDEILDRYFTHYARIVGNDAG